MSKSDCESESESKSESDCESCLTCGMLLDDDTAVTYVTGITKEGKMLEFCSEKCMKSFSGQKHRAQKSDDPFTVPVSGTYNDGIITGVAEFSPHGIVQLKFTNPSLKATCVVPKAFLDVVAAIYDPGRNSN
jgi:ribosomal protein L24E